jgi:hypothetical protein
MKEAARLSVSLRIWGDDLMPSGVTSYLGVAPTESQTKGDRRNTPAGKVFIAPSGMWSLSYLDCARTDELSSQLKKVIQLFDRQKNIAGIQGAEEARVDVYISKGRTESPTVELLIPAADIGSLAAAGLGVAVTVL